MCRGPHRPFPPSIAVAGDRSKSVGKSSPSGSLTTRRRGTARRGPHRLSPPRGTPSRRRSHRSLAETFLIAGSARRSAFDRGPRADDGRRRSNPGEGHDHERSTERSSVAKMRSATVIAFRGRCGCSPPQKPAEIEQLGAMSRDQRFAPASRRVESGSADDRGHRATVERAGADDAGLGLEAIHFAEQIFKATLLGRQGKDDADVERRIPIKCRGHRRRKRRCPTRRPPRCPRRAGNSSAQGPRRATRTC